MINVGILGYGLSGRVFHMPVIRSLEGFRVTSIMTKNPEAIAEIHEADPSVWIASTPEEILESPAVDLVVVAVPNTLHYDLASKALKHGKHVVVEKPFTITAAEAGALRELARQQGKVLSTYHNRRWDGDFLTIRKLIESGVLGSLAEFESHFDRFRPAPKAGWREESGPGTGMLYDLGSHLLDQAITLFGMPQRLYADLRIQRPASETVDSFELILDYEGLKVTLKSGSLVREPLPRFILQGDKGSFVKYGLDVQEDALKAGHRPEQENAWGQEPETQYGTLHTEVGGVTFRGAVETLPGDYREFYRGIRKAVNEGGEPPVTAAQAENVMRLIELAMESAEKGIVMVL